MRYHIVAVHVSRQIEDPFKNLVQHWPDLVFFAVLKHPLNDAASELMHTHLIHSPSECFHNKLHLLRGYLLDNLLNNVITICVLNATDYIRFDFLNNLVSKIRGKTFQGLLNDSTAILVTGKDNYVVLHHRKKSLLLTVRAEFKHLLDYVVAKDVFHQLMRGRLQCILALRVSNLFKKNLILLFFGLFKPLLNEA